MRKDISGFQVRWDKARAAAARSSGVWPDRTVAEYAAERVRREPDRILLVDRDRPLTVAELFDKAARLANWLVRQGIEPGHVISFQLPNWHEANIVNLAAALVGAVVNPLVPIMRDSEVRYMLRDSGSRMVFCPRVYRKFDYLEMMGRVAADLPNGFRTVQVRGEPAGEDVLDHIFSSTEPLREHVDVHPDAVKLVMYTSGTTGRPKAVLHSHNTIHAENAKTLAAAGLGADDVMFNPSPVTHVTGALYGLNLPWYGGLKIVLLDDWDPAVAFDLMDRHRCSYMAGATPFLQDLIRESDRRGRGLPALRRFTCGGAGVPPSLIQDARRAFPNALVWRAFGATECPTITVAPEDPDDLLHASETDGRVWRAEVKIVDPASGAPVPAGSEGEILARADNMALGYARSDDNEAAYDDEGFFRTGDLGRVVDAKYLVVTGRKKDLIIRAGENISAKEIEDVLCLDPRIADVAVVGKPAPRIGEAICAVIVPAAGAVLDLAAVATIIATAGLARQKTPEHLVLMDELPRTAAGKVRKDQLRLAVAASDA